MLSSASRQAIIKKEVMCPGGKINASDIYLKTCACYNERQRRCILAFRKPEISFHLSLKIELKIEFSL